MAALAAAPMPEPATDAAARGRIHLGVIGYGYWGTNILRNLRSLPGAHVDSLCDINQKSLQRAGQTYPELHLTKDAAEILSSPNIDAVAIITPVRTHFELAQA